MPAKQHLPDDISTHEKKWELRMFLFLTVVLAPAFTVATIVVYGFAIWFSQLIMGPPGPPGS